MPSSTRSRRSFLRDLSSSTVGSAAFFAVGGRGSEALLGQAATSPGARSAAPGRLIRLDSNENPHGPAKAAIEALQSMFSEASRYPDATDAALTTALAARHKVPEDHVVLGAGSGEVLKIITEAFVSRGRALVSATPTFEIPTRTATRMGVEVRAPRVTGDLGLDLDAMLEASTGAGLVFLCNPNNPTGTVHSKSTISEFVAKVRSRAPDAYILVDEAYFEYVDDPGYGTALDLALADEKILIARTFSKVFGLAGLRIGYAIARPATIAKLVPFRVGNGISTLGAAAAIASIPLHDHVTRQQQLNRDARDFARRELAKLGFTAQPTHTNFLMFDVGRDAAKLRTACAEAGLAIGRVFEPLTTHARVSIGTMDEMTAAIGVLRGVLKA
jgi:histidinol-phosphate aminotransferase